MTADGAPRPDTGVGARTDHEQQPPAAGLEISNAIVRLLRSHAGRGPTKAKTTITAEFALVMLRDCLTTAEKSLAGDGHAQHVKEGRHALHHLIRSEAIAAVEDITATRVAAYLTDQHHDPDVAVIVFLFDARSRIHAE